MPFTFPEPEKQGFSAEPDPQLPPKNDGDRGLLSGLAMGGVAHHFMTSNQNKPSTSQQPSQYQAPPPSYDASASTPPPAGNRIPCNSTQPFPLAHYLGPAPFHDLNGEPVYVASAILGDSVQPCKAAPHLPNNCRFPFAGVEAEHSGRYDILPITNAMEWVHTSRGQVPKGRRPVEGGYEQDGKHLFHAAAVIQGVRVPGKTGDHLGAANLSFGGAEVIVSDSYDILCWR